MESAITVSTRWAIVLDKPLPTDEHPMLVYLARLSRSSRRTMRQALDTIASALLGAGDAAMVDWSKLRYQHVALIRSELAEKYKPATASRMLCALRGVAHEAWRLGQMSAEDYQRIRDVKGVKSETLPAGRRIAAGELIALMRTCENDPSPAGVRDSAIIGLLYSCGLRRAELAGLDQEDYDKAEGELVVRGKGRKERLMPIANGAQDALDDWLIIRGSEAGPLFWPIRRGGHLCPGRITTQAVYNMLQKRAEEADVRKLSPHDFRRTFVTDLLELGADLSVVQRLAGHSKVDTTARYDRRGEEAKRQAVQLLHVPYRRRLDIQRR